MSVYQRHFGLSRAPFSIAPNPRFLYMSRQHREALAALMYGVRMSDGFVQLTGEVGTGKTTICRCLVEQLPNEVDVALILSPRVTAVELLASLCDELKIAYPKGTTSIKVLTDVLNAFLLENHAAGRRTVLIIDEAQCLSPETLEQVRLLTNLETSNAKLLQVILVGQPELRELLARDDLRQLAQRITARFHLTPISPAETAAYIRHRLKLAGARGEVFDRRAIDMVHQFAQGVPRLINVLCDRAMLGAFVEDVPRVDARIMSKAAAEVLPAAQLGGTRPRPWRRGLVLTLLLCAGVVAGLWYGATRLDNSSAGGLPPITAEQPLSPPVTVRPPDETAPAPDRSTVPVVSAPGEPTFEPRAPERVPDSPVDVDPVRLEPRISEPLGPTEASVEEGDETAPDAMLTEEPSIPAVSLAEHLDDAGSAVSARAWPGLYRLWGFDSAAATDDQACAQAPNAGLSCLNGTGSWGLLRRFDRPAVLLLQADGGRFVAVVLRRVDGDLVELEIGGEVIRVPRAELERRWHGAYRLLWKKPPSGHVTLKIGMRGTDVRWLRERLARVNGQEAAPADPALYDEALASAVKVLQREHGLVADGIAGARTLMALNNLIADPEIPRLVGNMPAASE